MGAAIGCNGMNSNSGNTRLSYTRYCRTPLPEAARLKIGWIFFWLAALGGSVFIGFAIHGTVAEPGLVIGLVIAVIPLIGLSVLVIRHWSAMSRLPPELAEEWRTGRAIPATGAPAVIVPARFSYKDGAIEFRTDGLLLTGDTLLGLRGATDAAGKMWMSQTIGEYFLPWHEIAAWEVHTDSDAPDFYQLPLQTRGYLRVRRFKPAEGSEADLLDAVRSVGRLPIRLLCDIEDT